MVAWAKSLKGIFHRQSGKTADYAHFLLNRMMIFVTQTSTGTMVKCVPQEQMFVVEVTLLENHFLPSSGFSLLMLVEGVLIS